MSRLIKEYPSKTEGVPDIRVEAKMVSNLSIEDINLDPINETSRDFERVAPIRISASEDTPGITLEVGDEAIKKTYDEIEFFDGVMSSVTKETRSFTDTSYIRNIRYEIMREYTEKIFKDQNVVCSGLTLNGVICIYTGRTLIDVASRIIFASREAIVIEGTNKGLNLGNISDLSVAIRSMGKQMGISRVKGAKTADGYNITGEISFTPSDKEKDLLDIEKNKENMSEEEFAEYVSELLTEKKKKKTISFDDIDLL